MRTGGQQIQQNQIGQAAAGQKQIVRDLQEVLDMLAARQTGKSNTAAASPSESGTSRTPLAPGNRSRVLPTAKPLATGRPPPLRRDRPATARITNSTSDELRAAIRRLWGQLPEHARGQMLQSPVEEFPPKYEVMIEEYFRRLSEEKGE